MFDTTCAQCESSKAKALQQNTIINPEWILLDTATTESTFKTSHLIDRIRECETDERLHMLTNGGSEPFISMGICKLIPEILHLSTHSIANILAFTDVVDLPVVDINYALEEGVFSK